MSRTNAGIRFLRVRRLSVTCATAVAVAVISLLTACDDASTTAPTVTIAPASTTSSTGTPGTSTSTTTSTTTTTVAVTTTTTLDDLKAQIAADFEKAYFRNYELVLTPSLDNLDARVAEISVPGSDAFTRLVAYVKDLVRLGDRVVPNDPDILKVNVENVELVGEPPYTTASVTSCQVTNRKRVTPAENSPISVEIPVGDSGKLLAYRTTEPVQLTATGWLQTSGNAKAVQFEGQDSCPAP
jgi:hypothetical protein